MIISTFIAFIVIFISATFVGSEAALFFSIFIFVIGHLICSTFQKTIVCSARNIFNIVLSVYVVFSLFHYFDASLDWGHFANDGKDEYKFLVLSETLKNTSSVTQLIKDCFVDRVHLENEGYIFYIGLLAYISETIFDGNHLFVQYLGSVIWGSALSLVVFKILLLFFDIKKSEIYALLYSLCTVVFVYSFSLLRDIHITFFYALSIYILLKKYSLRGLLVLVLNVIILWQLRTEHGVFAMMFVVYYLFERLKKNVFLVVLLLSSVCVIFFMYFGEILSNVHDSMINYENYTNDSVFAVSGSLGAIVYTFPTPIKEIVIVFLSQIQPFPSWSVLSDCVNQYGIIVALHTIIRAFFWYIVFYSIVLWLPFYNVYKKIPSKLIYLFFIAVVFFLLNTFNMSERRIMVLYPIVYILYLWIKEYCISYSKFLKTNFILTSIYLSLIILYLVVKN